MERPAAIALLREHVTDENLIKHCLATGAVMKALARHLREDAQRWELIGILHDIDFQEIGGDMQQHGIRGRDILLQYGLDPGFSDTVLRHNHLLYGGTYERPVEIGLQAADSVSGLVIACALVKGGNLSAVTAKTVAKKFKERSFAAGCDRERIASIQKIMELSVFYDVAIDGLLSIRDELGLT